MKNGKERNAGDYNQASDDIEVADVTDRLIINKADTTDTLARAALERSLVRYENTYRRLAR